MIFQLLYSSIQYKKMLSKKQKKEITAEYQQSTFDTGSSPVQIALLSANIKLLSEHIKKNKHDYSSLRGLQGMIQRRKKLLSYFASQSPQKYKELVTKLGIRH